MTIDPAARRQQASDYASARRRLFFADLLITLLGAWALLGLGLSAAIRAAIERQTANQWLVVPLYALVVGGAYALVSLPLSIYGGLILPRRYGLSHQTFGGWAADQIKGLAIGAPLLLGLLEALYAGLRAFPETWWIWAIGAGALLLIFLLWLVPAVVSPLFNRFAPLADAELRERLLALARRLGAPVKDVLTVDFSRRTTMANAYVTGIGSTHRVVLGDTLVSNYSADEIEAVMAHELSHYVKRDTLRLLAASIGSLALFFWLASLAVASGAAWLGLRGPADVAGLPVFALVMTILGLALQPLMNGYSRRIERAADRYALDATRRPAAFISAMRKLRDQNLGEHEPPAWAVILFSSHPPISARIRAAEDYARQHGLPAA
ncbi:MAG TPA: M48 family metallopeptidase [Herpetosiphonaceae bacterium]